jgi:hypothetical protein
MLASGMFAATIEGGDLAIKVSHSYVAELRTHSLKLALTVPSRPYPRRNTKHAGLGFPIWQTSFLHCVRSFT